MIPAGGVQAVITPAGWIRATYLAVGLALSVVAVLFAASTQQLSYRIFDFALVVAGIFVAVRLVRSGIIITADTIRIRGFFISRTLRRDQVTSVETFPFIDWKDSSGGPRRSCVFTFLGVTGGDDPNAHALRSAREKLRRWMTQDSASQAPV